MKLTEVLESFIDKNLKNLPSRATADVLIFWRDIQKMLKTDKYSRDFTEGSIYLFHNRHKRKPCISVSAYCKEINPDDPIIFWISEESYNKSCESNEMWSILWLFREPDQHGDIIIKDMYADNMDDLFIEFIKWLEHEEKQK